MIRVDVTGRLVRTVRKLGPQISVEVEEKLALVAAGFGDPHQHSGLGLRKIGRRSYEIRLGLQLRIVLIKEPDRLTAYDVMDHGQVSQWLRSRRGD
jgi:hypothetical protein